MPAPAAGPGPASPASPGPASPGASGGPGPAEPPAAKAPDSGSPAGGGGSAAGSTADAGAAHETPTTVGPGEEAADATSRSSGGFQRREYVREAERLIVEGDSVGGDKNIYLVGGKERPKLHPLPTRIVEPIRNAFAAPGGYSDLYARCARSHTVILRGPAGSGKQGTAIRMLLDLGVTHLFQLDARLDLTRPADWIETDLQGRDRIERGAGFILMQPASFSSLYGSVLQGLDEALRRAQARLIITADSAVSVADQDLREYMVELSGAPDYHAVTAERLKYRLGADAADQLLTRSDIRDEISQLLADEPSCMLAAELAEAIAEEADRAGTADGFDVAAIKAWRSRRGAETFDIWFAGLGDTRTRSFAIALAALNGLPYNAVAKAARSLYERFDTPAYMVMTSGEDMPPEGQRPFLMPPREWLYRLRARIGKAQVRGPYGLSPAETVEYRDGEYVQKVMTRAFADYQAQDKLLDWLGELTQDGSEQVRVFAGLALGRLASQSFDYFSSNLLARWANSDRPYHRDAVAFALRGAIINDPRLQANVNLMVTGWYANRDAPNQQATAARAYGIAYRHADPIAAFEALNRLTVINNIHVASAIGDSLADLLADGSDEIAGRVLAGLAESARDRERSPAVQLAFLILAAPFDKEVPADQPGVPATSWPLLLYLMTELPEARPSIVSLWQHVLNEGVLPGIAERVMSTWAAASESDPSMRQAFLRTARAIANDERSRATLVRYVAKWTSRENLQPFPIISAAMQTVIAERGAR